MRLSPTTIILTFMLSASVLTAGGNPYAYVSPGQQTLNELKTLLKSGLSCLDSALYNKVRIDANATKYYCDYVCSKYKAHKIKNYIESTYGQKGERLGAGSFGVVYKYVDSKGRDWAIKVPKSFKYKALFEELHSSNCIKEKVTNEFLKAHMGYIRECVTPSGDKPHLIMTYYALTLEDKMNDVYTQDETTYDNKKLNMLYTDMFLLAKEVQALHDAGLAHRDMKPENAMIGKNNLPVLVDFGLTTVNVVSAKTMCGSPLFMDPELMTRKVTGGASADIYALGIMYYLMMRGSQGNTEVQSMIMNGGYQTPFYNPNFNSLNLKNNKFFILKMLRSSKGGLGNPGQRWDSARVVQYLQDVLKNLNNPVKEEEKVEVKEAPKQPTKIEVKVEPKQEIVYKRTPTYKYTPPAKVKIERKVVRREVTVMPTQRIVIKAKPTIVHVPYTPVTNNFTPITMPITPNYNQYRTPYNPGVNQMQYRVERMVNANNPGLIPMTPNLYAPQLNYRYLL